MFSLKDFVLLLSQWTYFQFCAQCAIRTEMKIVRRVRPRSKLTMNVVRSTVLCVCYVCLSSLRLVLLLILIFAVAFETFAEGEGGREGEAGFGVY